MKILLPAILSLSVALSANSQNDSLLTGKPSEKTSYLYFVLSSSCSGVNAQEISSPECFYIYDLYRCVSEFNSQKYFRVVYRRSHYYIRTEDIKNADTLISILSKTTPEKKHDFQVNGFIKSTVEDSIMAIKELAKSEKEIKQAADKVIKAGIALLSYSIYDESEATKGTGVRFRVINGTIKSVKYIWFNVTGINPVGDPVIDPVKKKSLITLRGVGPILPTENATFEFEYAWFTNLVESVKIGSIKVQFMDGSIKTIVNPKTIDL